MTLSTLAIAAVAFTQPVPNSSLERTPTIAGFRSGSVETRLKSLKAKLDPICQNFGGRMGYCVVDLQTGKRIDFRGTEIFPTASTIKTSVALEVIRQVEEGRRKWTDKLEVPPTGRREESMWSYFFKDGTKLDFDGWVNLMVGVSDNTATWLLRDTLTCDAVNARMESLGLPNTKVLGTFPPDRVREVRLRQKWGLGMTTPREMARLFELIAKYKAAQPGGCEKLLRLLSKQYWDDMAIAAAPIEVKVCAKSGAITRSRSEVAVVYGTHPYVLAIYTDDQKDKRWEWNNEGEETIRKMCRIIWATLDPRGPFSLPKGYEKFNPTGAGAEV